MSLAQCAVRKEVAAALGATMFAVAASACAPASAVAPSDDRGVPLLVHDRLSPVADASPAPVAMVASESAMPPQDAGAPPDCSAPASNGASPRWIARSLHSGTMPGPHRLFTFDLGRVGDRATLVLTEKIAKKPPAKGAAWDWKCNEAQRFAGTVAERGNQLVFRLAESSQPSELRDMTCTLRSVRVAAANATRVSVPSKMEGCNAHRWSPATAVTQRALECKAEWLPYWARDAFAAPVPGLEHLTVDEDDCGDPTQALRLIRANGEVAPVFRD